MKSIFKPSPGITFLNAEEEEKQNKISGYLPPQERDAVFKKAGLGRELSSMDELDKDMLVMSARDFSLVDLKKDYPKLSGQKLKRLQTELRKSK